MLNNHQLLGSALQTLSIRIAATNGSSSVPSVLGDDNSTMDLSGKKKNNVSDELLSSLGKSIEKHGKSLVDVARIEVEQKSYCCKNSSKAAR